jgi:hypothetical protein
MDRRGAITVTAAFAHHIPGSQLGLLDWKGPTTNEREETAEGTRPGVHVQRHDDRPASRGRDEDVRGEVPDGQHHGEEHPGLSENDRLGARPSKGREAARPLPEVHAVGTGDRENAEGRARRAEGADQRRAEGKRTWSVAEEVARILPGVASLCWTPCLKRAEGSEREHCWFLASTLRPTLYCWDCKPEVA